MPNRLLKLSLTILVTALFLTGVTACEAPFKWKQPSPKETTEAQGEAPGAPGEVTPVLPTTEVEQGTVADGENCSQNEECVSGICADDVCQVAACDDGVANGDETDIDCGGSCPACADGMACANAADCTSTQCLNAFCIATGSVVVGDSCTDPAQCASGVCDQGACQAAPTCDDQVKNAEETDVDCGGAACDPCADTLACTVASDCQNGVCAQGACQAATCADNVKNADETDIDCGGSCNPCGVLLACAAPTDCVSGLCENNICQAAPNCTDGVQNADETDVDCGGGCEGCEEGSACGLDSDCLAGLKCQEDQCVKKQNAAAIIMLMGRYLYGL